MQQNGEEQEQDNEDGGDVWQVCVQYNLIALRYHLITFLFIDDLQQSQQGQRHSPN